MSTYHDYGGPTTSGAVKQQTNWNLQNESKRI